METLILKCRDNFSLRQLAKLRRDLFEKYNPETQVRTGAGCACQSLAAPARVGTPIPHAPRHHRPQKYEARVDIVKQWAFRRLASVAKRYQLTKARKILLAQYEHHERYAVAWFNRNPLTLEDPPTDRHEDGFPRGWKVPFKELFTRMIQLIFECDEVRPSEHRDNVPLCPHTTLSIKRTPDLSVF